MLYKGTQVVRACDVVSKSSPSAQPALCLRAWITIFLYTRYMLQITRGRDAAYHELNILSSVGGSLNSGLRHSCGVSRLKSSGYGSSYEL
jgi:hypothetical protein